MIKHIFLIYSLFMMCVCNVNAQENTFTIDFSKSKKGTKIENIMDFPDCQLVLDRDIHKDNPSKIQRTNGQTYLEMTGESSIEILSKGKEIIKVKFYTGLNSKYLVKPDTCKGIIDKGRRVEGGRIKVFSWQGSSERVIVRAPAGAGFLRLIKIEIIFRTQETAEVITQSFSDVGYATLFYNEKALVIPKGVKARTYKIEGHYLSVSKEYHENEVLPKGTAVVLEAKKGVYHFKVTKKQGIKDPKNVLRGTSIDKETTGGQYYYAFARGSEGIGFYWMSPNGGAFTNAAHKAYLPFTPHQGKATRAFFLFDTTLNIKESTIKNNNITDDELYNTKGQRVSKNFKGIIIINGRKYLNR